MSTLSDGFDIVQDSTVADLDDAPIVPPSKSNLGTSASASASASSGNMNNMMMKQNSNNNQTRRSESPSQSSGGQQSQRNLNFETSGSASTSPSGGQQGGGLWSDEGIEASSPSQEKFVEKIGPFEFSRAKYEAMCSALKVAKWHDTRHQLKTISNVMNGEELTIWFVQNGYVSSNEEGVVLGCFLLKQKVLFPMLKRLAPRGFENTHDLFYMITEERQEKNILGAAFSKAKAALTQADTSSLINPFSNEPVKFVSEGFHVEAIVYEHERYSTKTMEKAMHWSCEHLNEGVDPKHYSMEPDQVPIPSVGNASPDLCEWIDEWIPVVNASKTDAEGWMYGGDNFASLATTSTKVFNQLEHRVRARAWHRFARKIPETEQLIIEEEVEETSKEVDERVHREMLERIEHAKRVRQKYFFQWNVLKCSLKTEHSPPNSCFVVVEHFATRHRSNAAPQRPSSEDEVGVVDFPIVECTGQFDVCAEQIIGIGVWANLSLGRKLQLGYAQFCIPENPVQAGSDVVGEMKEEDIEIVDKEGRNLGNVKFEWTAQLAPSNELGFEELGSPGSPGETTTDESRRASSLLHTPNCILELNVAQITKVDSRILERSRGSRFKCLAFFMPGGEPHAFLRVKYRGLVSTMTLESQRVLLTEITRFDFSTFLAVRHLVPIQLEVWFERGSPGNMTQECIGELRLDFIRSGLEVSTSEKPISCPSDLGKKIFTKQMDLLPEEVKPKAPPPPANPVLEELLSTRKSGTGGEKEKLVQQPEKDPDQAYLETIYGSINNSNSSPDANKKQQETSSNAGDNNAAAANASSPSKQIPGQFPLPQMMLNSCMMEIRYKYVVEGETDGMNVIDEELKALISENKEEGGDKKEKGGDDDKASDKKEEKKEESGKQKKDDDEKNKTNNENANVTSSTSTTTSSPKRNSEKNKTGGDDDLKPAASAAAAAA